MDAEKLAEARERRALAFRVFIYCDDHSHSPKREPLAVYCAVPGGGWQEEVPRKRGSRSANFGAGMHMIGNEVAQPGWALDSEVSNADVRTRYEIACGRTPRCRNRPVPARQENLFPVLDALRHAGMREVPLAVLAAMLGERSLRNQARCPEGTGNP